MSQQTPSIEAIKKITDGVWQFEGDWYVSGYGCVNTEDNAFLLRFCLSECDRLKAERAGLMKKLPKKMKLPCGCYKELDYSGCECGNYDDAHSQGYAQGWNDAIDKLSKVQP